MITPAAYVLRVPEGRRKMLLGTGYYSPEEYAAHWREFWSAGESVAEPVPAFDHSRRAPLIVFACFDHRLITHIADGRKGSSAGTGLVRLNLSALQPLTRPIAFDEVVARAPARVRKHLRRAFDNGGKLPPKSLGAVIDAVLALEPDISDRLQRFSQRRIELLARLTPRGRTNLAEQKETLSTALDIAGIGTSEVLAWSPVEGEPRSFLEGMPHVYLREDAVLISDYSDMPGFDVIKKYPFAARQFQATDNPSIRLKVIMANRLPLEEQTGADLIYYNETFKSFVMVQYKSMNKGKKGAEFRWQPGDKLAEEIDRMDGLLQALAAVPDDPAAASFRLHSNPFFLKLCPRLIFNPDDKGLAKGMYLPLDFWKALAADPVTKGPRHGRVITYDNVSRRLSNSQFLALVAQAWVGTTVPQSRLLEQVIESVIQTGKTVTLAVKAAVPPRPVDIDDDEDEDEGSVDISDLL
ncbi:MAG: hypothetical protein ACREV7_20020 [Steroidobacteraceae bacterium]